MLCVLLKLFNIVYLLSLLLRQRESYGVSGQLKRLYQNKIVSLLRTDNYFDQFRHV